MTLNVWGSNVVTPNGIVREQTLSCVDSVIASITPSDQAVSVDLRGTWVMPGLIDLHVHGGGGASLSSPDLEEVRHALTFHRAHGTTTSLISLVCAPIAQLCEQLERIAGWLNDPATGLGKLVNGVHLEGPFLSQACCGALDPAHMVDANATTVAALLNAAQGWLRVITVAPERPGVLEAIPILISAGVVVAIGHTDATAASTTTAIDAGATMATHLGNGMRPFHHREPGAFGACLVDQRVTCELIVDGHHLHPDTVRLAATVKSDAAWTLCTDAISAAGSREGAFRLGSRRVVVRDGVARIDGTGSLAGSTLTMHAAASIAHRLGLDVAAIAKAASTNPARLLNQVDRGIVAIGKRADLIVLNDRFELVAAVAQGAVVDSGTS